MPTSLKVSFMATTIISCDYCGRYFHKENKLLNRSRRLDREICCSRICSNYLKHRKNPTMAQAGRERLRRLNSLQNNDPFHQHKAHLASEEWKYAEIKILLENLALDYVFEFPLFPFENMFIFDLFVPFYYLLIEFDGPHHCGGFNYHDAIKDQTAADCGFNVVRVPVDRSSIYPKDSIEWLVR